MSQTARYTVILRPEGSTEASIPHFDAPLRDLSEGQQRLAATLDRPCDVVRHYSDAGRLTVVREQ